MIRPVIRHAILPAAAALVLGTAAAQDAPTAFAGADPDIEAAGGRYWIYPTNSGEGGAARLYAWTSRDLRSWQRGAELLRLDAIRWIGDDGAPRHFLWAPDMVAANGRHYLYYSVGPQNPTPSRIGVAICNGPGGPCTDSGKPLVTGGKGFEAIDPAIFIDRRSGHRYLYAGGSAGATLRVWRLKADMITIDREIPVETPRHFTEGAFMHERGGVYYLSYSHGSWRHSTYSVHLCHRAFAHWSVALSRRDPDQRPAVQRGRGTMPFCATPAMGAGPSPITAGKASGERVRITGSAASSFSDYAICRTALSPPSRCGREPFQQRRKDLKLASSPPPRRSVPAHRRSGPASRYVHHRDRAQ